MTVPAPSVTYASSATNSKLIVALDYPGAAEALELVDLLGETVKWYKVGLELYLAAGNTIIHTLVRHGLSVFLDLKLHDIPNQVAGAVRSASHSGASLLTIHATGGPSMIEAAVQAARSAPLAPKILAVTVLTSFDRQQLDAVGISSTPAEQVELLAKMAINAGADGLVCSAEESGHLRSILGPQPLLVVPGIRPAGSASGDQRRIATPEAALRSGASYLVVGRPITEAPDPKSAAEAILSSMAYA